MNKQLKQLEDRLYRVSEPLMETIRALPGDIMILGAGGKMGPSLARLARVAVEKAGVKKRVLAVSRFNKGNLAAELNSFGVETIAADLLDEAALAELPQVANIIYLVGQKFGTSGNEGLTWAMNTYLPGRVADRFRKSRIVAFSTGNVYPLVPVDSGGATEETLPEPVGEYAQSCLGRERLFSYFSSKNGTPVLIYRLNYSVDLRYGVLMDIAQAIRNGDPVDLTMGYVNVIWQGDANEIALRALAHCASPSRLLNVTGPETLSVKTVAEKFGRIFGREPVFINQEAPTALLSNASEMVNLFGMPSLSVDDMIAMAAEWLNLGGELLDKPTHFQERKGKF